MNKNLGIIIVILVIAIGGYFVFASSQDAPQTNMMENSSEITVEESFYDFGDIDIFGGKVTTTYVLKNEGTEDVTVTKAVTSCMCTEGEIGGIRFGMHDTATPNVVIPAGGEQILTAIFDPLAHGPEGTGRISRQLMIKTDSSATPEITVRFSANVVKN